MQNILLLLLLIKLIPTSKTTYTTFTNTTATTTITTTTTTIFTTTVISNIITNKRVINSIDQFYRKAHSALKKLFIDIFLSATVYI